MEAETRSRRRMLSIFGLAGLAECRLLVSGLCGMICLAMAGPALGTENRFDGVYTGKAT